MDHQCILLLSYSFSLFPLVGVIYCELFPVWAGLHATPVTSAETYYYIKIETQFLKA